MKYLSFGILNGWPFVITHYSCLFYGTSASPTSLSPSNELHCFWYRICHCEGDDESPLITPCHCTGSLHFVHQACLQQWIKSSDTRCCELCKYEFIMETKLKPLRKVGVKIISKETASFKHGCVSKNDCLTWHNGTLFTITQWFPIQWGQFYKWLIWVKQESFWLYALAIVMVFCQDLS